MIRQPQYNNLASGASIVFFVAVLFITIPFHDGSYVSALQVPTTQFKHGSNPGPAGNTIESRNLNRFQTSLFQQEDSTEPSESSAMEDLSLESSMSQPTDYGFDKPRDVTNVMESSTPSRMSDDRLRQSLKESAKFKVRNDARFTWLATFLVSAAYTYGCFGGKEGEELLSVAGIPSGGLAGGAAGALAAIGSLLLFFLPEIFGNNKQSRM